MYICLTNIDSKKGTLCTESPMKKGPKLPKIKGWRFKWCDNSNWPVKLNSDGSYKTTPKYYGVCDDDADIDKVGVLGTFTRQEFLQLKRDEFYARRPYSSWLFDESTFEWNPPTPYPEDYDVTKYDWDEETTSWIEANNE